MKKKKILVYELYVMKIQLVFRPWNHRLWYLRE